MLFFASLKEYLDLTQNLLNPRKQPKLQCNSREEILKVDYPAYGNSSSERKASIDRVNRIEVQ
jgi:hypothetical protein